MGCLPPIVLLLVGAAVGWWFDGRFGATVGAAIGLALGLLVGLPMLLSLRRANRRD